MDGPRLRHVGIQVATVTVTLLLLLTAVLLEVMRRWGMASSALLAHHR